VAVTRGLAGGSASLHSYAATDGDGLDLGLLPLAFLAVTVQEYVLPAVRPVTVSGPTASDVAPALPPLGDVHDAV